MTTPSHFIFLGQKFTLRQMRVIYLKSMGLKHRQIGAYLELTYYGIKAYLDKIRYRLGLDSCSELIALRSQADFGENGYYDGHYLFEGFTKMPWHKKAN
jgi:DNA-binding CsgD family transcriptional regulator